MSSSGTVNLRGVTVKEAGALSGVAPSGGTAHTVNNSHAEPHVPLLRQCRAMLRL